MIRAITAALAAAFVLSACEEEKGAMGEILKAEQEVAKSRAEALKQSADFIAKKEAEGGWTKTASGMLYKWVRRNPADTSRPGPTTQVLAYYEGSLPDGRVFDSAYRRGQPAPFGLGDVVKGWQEAVPLMKVGETMDLVLPPGLGYGAMGRPPNIPPNSPLLFRIELVAFVEGDKVVGNEAAPALDAPPAPSEPPPPAPGPTPPTAKK